MVTTRMAQRGLFRRTGGRGARDVGWWRRGVWALDRGGVGGVGKEGHLREGRTVGWVCDL
ncbi:hypothetical protein [Streptomyces sp. GESEQ-4]|uniref:hypothetical protein n=1 Tax=Streptomyces sp. GESEQ-4 TaxID=2812655 RepID=UPI001B334A8F